MDNKQLAIIAVVAVVIIAIAAAFVVTGGSKDKDSGSDGYEYKFEFNQDVRFAVFGNVNGDDDIDQKDMDLLKDIVDGKVLFDKTKNAYADVNNDGVIDKKDIDALQKILDHEETTLYYWNVAAEVASIEWPLDKDKLKIAVHHMYPMDALAILGDYDKVVGVTQSAFGNSIVAEDRYPGIGTKIQNIGTPKDSPEKLASCGANLFITHASADYSKVQTLIDNGLDLQIIMLPMISAKSDIVSQYGGLLILGFILDDMEAAHKYVDWADGIEKKVADGVAKLNVDTQTFITPFISSSDNGTSIKLDTISPSGSIAGDVNTLMKLPMRSVNLVANGCPVVSLEWVYTVNPDVIFIIQFQNGSKTVEDVRNDLNEKAKIFENTDAYKNKQVYGVNFYNIANYFGISQLLLLASHIWPDVFSEEEGWEAMQYCYDNFSLYTDPDVKNMGNAQPYKMD